MRVHCGFFVFFLFLAGCAAYKELEPAPPVSPMERGYIELKKDEDDFRLDKDKKYFIKFPSPGKDHFYLVLVTRVKPAIHSYLTDVFDDGGGQIVPIRDEAASNDSVSVYAIDLRVPTFFWMVDTVRYDVELPLKFRYVPQWRYTFENTYAQFQEVLAKSRVDRSTYNSVDANFSFDRFDFEGAITHAAARTGNLKTMNNELLRLESIFPKDIAAARDTAYEKYVAFRNRVNDELTFQDNYSTLLAMFRKESETRGSAIKFLEAAPSFSEIVSQRDRFPGGALEKARNVFLERLSEVDLYYENLLRKKDDLGRISPQPSLDVVAGLYRACGRQIPKDAEAAIRFIGRFNAEIGALQRTNNRFEELRSYFTRNIAAPTDSFYADLLAKVSEIRSGIPELQINRFERYGNYACAVRLASEITTAATKANDFEVMYQTAGGIAAHLSAHAWPSAESLLRELYDSRRSLEVSPTGTQRGLLVRRFENDIFSGVQLASRQRVDAFVKQHEMTTDNISALYNDSAFVPVYQLTFSSISQNDLLQKRKQIENYLAQVKYIQFPENSIKNIYREFIRSVNDHGVEKARAIAEHGRLYNGTDKQVKGLVDECNVNAPKWILRPKEYRKLFALPVTSNRQGVNEYMFRVRLQIPSEAQFPVFDVNIKLPTEIAENAGKQQWYEEITIDKKPIKNEGRFRITAPTPANNYEAQVSPVQMDKEGTNILEVRFKYPGFKVFEVSAMAQVPIIRKN